MLSLREYREAHGLQQRDVAKRLGVHVQTVYKWEALHEPRVPSLEYMLAMRELYGLSLESWLQPDAKARLEAIVNPGATSSEDATVPVLDESSQEVVDDEEDEVPASEASGW